MGGDGRGLGGAWGVLESARMYREPLEGDWKETGEHWDVLRGIGAVALGAAGGAGGGAGLLPPMSLGVSGGPPCPQELLQSPVSPGAPAASVGLSHWVSLRCLHAPQRLSSPLGSPNVPPPPHPDVSPPPDEERRLLLQLRDGGFHHLHQPQAQEHVPREPHRDAGHGRDVQPPRRGLPVRHWCVSPPPPHEALGTPRAPGDSREEVPEAPQGGPESMGGVVLGCWGGGFLGFLRLLGSPRHLRDLRGPQGPPPWGRGLP